MGNGIKRVVIIGLDGAGNAVKEAVTPNIDQILSRGAVTYNARTVFPSISGECWGALFHGVGPEKHGLTNDIAEQYAFPEDSKYPSFFKVVRNAWPESKLGSFCKWKPINSGIIEQSADFYNVVLPDDELALAAAEYIRENDFKLLFIAFDDCDGAGHAYEYRSDMYYKQVSKTDENVGIIINALKERDLLEDSFIILTADHGGGGFPKSHGSDDSKDMTIFWGCYGPGVIPGSTIEDSVNIMDTAAVVAHVLGIEAPEEWDARVPEGIFR